MSAESYTYEDYLKDFELDYLGFDKVLNEPDSDPHSEKITKIVQTPEVSDSRKNIHNICPFKCD